MTVPVAGTVLMLLLSGPAPGLPAPSARARRLPGGWAFMLCTVVVSMLFGPGTTGGG